MKNIFTTACLLVACIGFAQTTSRPTTTTTTTTTTTSRATQLCREWKIQKTENFGEQHEPTEAQRGDKMTINSNGTYTLIMNGVTETGTWVLDKPGTLLTLTSSASVIKKFKILEASDAALKIDYRDADDIHNIVFYTATPASR